MEIPCNDRQRGFSLVEILVGTAVSLFLLAVLITVFVTNKQAYRVQEGANTLQENGRFAMSFIGHSLRMADHWGGVESDAVTRSGSIAITGVGACDQAWATDIGVGVQGYDGASAISGISGLPSGCISASDYVAGTDLVVVRRSGTGMVDNDSLYLRAAVGDEGMLGQAPTTGVLPNLGLADEDGTANYPYHVDLWFVRACSVPAGGTGSGCDAAADGGQPIPTLSRLTLDGRNLVVQPLVEGIENLQIEYGRDVDEDGNVDRIDTAATLNALSADQREAAWGQVISARVALVSRSLQRDATFRSGGDLVLVGDQGPGGDNDSSSPWSVPEAQRHYLRRQYTQTFQIRNRTRS